MALPSSNNEVTSRKLGSAISALWTKIKSTFAPVSTTVTNVAYDSTNKKLTKTINGTTSDIVTASTLKTAMSLNNVTNDAQVKRSEMGTASGVATLDANGIINSSQLPSYVDDVLEYSSKSSFPATGETGKIYVDTSTNLTWRWSGTTYVEISPSLALGETDSTAYRGDRGKTAYDHSQTTHARADATKTEASTTNGNIKIDGTETTVYTHPTTTAVAAAAKKVGMDSTGHVVLGSALAASDVGLGNVDNKSEATIKSDFTGSVADDDTGFPTGNDVYEAIVTNGKGIEIVTNSNTFAEVDAIYAAGKFPIYRFALPNNPVYFYLPMTGHPYSGTGSYQFSGTCAVNGKSLFYISLGPSGWGTLSEKRIITKDEHPVFSTWVGNTPIYGFILGSTVTQSNSTTSVLQGVFTFNDNITSGPTTSDRNAPLVGFFSIFQRKYNDTITRQARLYTPVPSYTNDAGLFLKEIRDGDSTKWVLAFGTASTDAPSKTYCYATGEILNSGYADLSELGNTITTVPTFSDYWTVFRSPYIVPTAGSVGSVSNPVYVNNNGELSVCSEIIKVSDHYNSGTAIYGWHIGTSNVTTDWYTANFYAVIWLGDWTTAATLNCATKTYGILNINHRMSGTVSASNEVYEGRITSINPTSSSGSYGWAVYAVRSDSTYKIDWYIGRNPNSTTKTINYAAISIFPMLNKNFALDNSLTRRTSQITTYLNAYNSIKTVGAIATQTAIGNASTPVYVDSNGYITPCNKPIQVVTTINTSSMVNDVLYVM